MKYDFLKDEIIKNKLLDKEQLDIVLKIKIIDIGDIVDPYISLKHKDTKK